MKSTKRIYIKQNYFPFIRTNSRSILCKRILKSPYYATHDQGSLHRSRVNKLLFFLPLCARSD